MIGRKKEIHLIKQLYSSKKSELLCIAGRRRVGITYLIWITTYGIQKNQHSIGVVDHDLTMEILFE